MSKLLSRPRAALLAAVVPFLLGLAGNAAAPSAPAAPRVDEERGAANSAAALRSRLFARLGVDAWHRAGHRGQGVKVAILDSGFRDWKSFLGKALPEKVTVRSFRADEDLEARDSQHGILCGEVVHALAPDAEILFANWDNDRPETFLQAVKWAREQGAKILSCSLIMPSWSDGDGGGSLNEGLAKIVGSGDGTGDMLCFASAGNIAQRHWCGPLQRDTAGYHLWTEGHRQNVVTPWGDDRVSVELYGKGCDRLELLVYDATTSKLVGKSPAGCDASPSGCPVAVVRFLPVVGRRYYVKVRGEQAAGEGREPFHLVVLGGNLQHTTAAGSIPFPADGAAALAVGAVDAEGQRLGYSSCGGGKLRKPDFVAEVPFPSLWRDRPFAGTSAAAPQAAALAALMWSREPGWTASRMTRQLQQSALSLGRKGHDCETGHGLLALHPLP